MLARLSIARRTGTNTSGSKLNASFMARHAARLAAPGSCKKRHTDATTEFSSAAGSDKAVAARPE